MDHLEPAQPLQPALTRRWGESPCTSEGWASCRYLPTTSQQLLLAASSQGVHSTVTAGLQHCRWCVPASWDFWPSSSRMCLPATGSQWATARGACKELSPPAVSRISGNALCTQEGWVKQTSAGHRWANDQPMSQCKWKNNWLPVQPGCHNPPHHSCTEFIWRN